MEKKKVWLVYYATETPLQIIGVASSKQGAETMADNVRKYEEENGFEILETSMQEIEIDKNYFVEDEEIIIEAKKRRTPRHLNEPGRIQDASLIVM
jgi:hypothetical protein